ncbi:hypothetical protein BH09VER1_BH09VER1_17150 [soil metagenome]
MRLRRNNAAFTLTELLVVVAIIGLLFALLLSSVNGVKERARTTQCMGRMKNVATMFNVYASENDDMYPQYVYSSGAPRITNPYDFLRPYMGTDDQKVWHCPSDPGTGPNNQPPGNTMTRSYSINGYIGVGYTFLHRSGINNPSKTILVAENWSGHLPTTINGAVTDTVYDAHGWGGSAAVLHEKKNMGNFAFVDGHIEKLNWLQVSPTGASGRGMIATDPAARDGL